MDTSVSRDNEAISDAPEETGKQEDVVTRSTERRELVCVCPYCIEHAYIQITLPADFGRVECITVEITSHDQGWADDKGAGSTSFFEMLIVGSNGHEKTRWYVDTNRIADLEPYTRTFTWPGSETITRLTSAMVHNLQPLDTIQLVPRAMFPGWRNWVHNAKMTISGTSKVTIFDALSRVPASTIYDLSSAAYSNQMLYQPLDVQRKEIRLLRLLPGEHGSIIRGVLEHAYLHEDHPPYEALSYCWGSAQTPLHPIDLSGRAWNVPESLHDAMLRLRRQDSERMLWIDAICINQLNFTERADQVREMRSIFSAATQVNVWLGEQDKMPLPAFAANIASIRPFFEHDKDLTIQDLEATSGARETTRQELGLRIGVEHYGELAEPCLLLEVPWFHRVWVLQEVYHAKRILVLCGDQTCPWSPVLRLNMMCQLRRESMFTYLPSISPLYAQMFKLTAPAAGSVADFGYSRDRLDMDILDIVIAGLDLEATDSRDKLYALLPFTSEKESSIFRVDYGKDEALVYRDFTRWWITTRKSLRILSAIHCSLGRTWQEWQPGLPNVRSDQLPAWSFWHTGKSCFSLTTLGCAVTTSYRASGETVLDEQLLTTGDAASLKLRGIILGSIQELTQYPYYRATGQEALDSSLEEFREVYGRLFDIDNARGIYSFGSQPRDGVVYDSKQHSAASDDHHRAHMPHAERTGAIQCHAACFTTLTNGSRALCPHTAKSGDVAVILFGGNVPYLLRKEDRMSRIEPGPDDAMPKFTFVGECFLPGFMHGEALKVADLEERVFEIV